MELSNIEIQKIIPHRYPFLLIDKITECIPGVSAIGIKNTTASEYYYQGHFPDYPVMPGVLVVEAMAQLGAIVMLSVDEHKGKKALFGGIKQMRFKKQVMPGDQLILECKITKTRGNVGFGIAKATVDGKVACQGEISFAIVD